MANYKVYKSSDLDPRVNLALEEHFMSTVSDNEIILFFWQSEHAVVIGRNQNPYQECNMKSLSQDHVTMVRRLSGGGAVYHDLGNLNFSFIAKNKHFDIEENFKVILKVLKDFGINGEFNGRNDLTVNDRKFSGNAFIHDDDRHLHHGTILIAADIDSIQKYLTVSHKKLDNKGFDSVKSRVLNLNELNPRLTVNDIIDHTIKYLSHSTNKINLELIDSKSFDIGSFLKKYMSHEWNFGDCPNYSFEASDKFEWGILSLDLNIINGVIEDYSFHTDAMDAESFGNLFNSLKEEALTYELIADKIKESQLNEKTKNDVSDFLNRHLFA